ncbi:MAG TPA: hypothetical protein VGD74_09155, partial [Vulgatibacter sp.]
RRKILEFAWEARDFDLAFDPSGNAKLAFKSGDGLHFLECGKDCESVPETWIVFQLGWGGRHAMALQGSKVRLVFYDGTATDSLQTSDSLLYAWCDGLCNQPGNWGAAPIGAPKGAGSSGVGLALGPTGQPTVAFAHDTKHLSVSRCSSACEREGASWSSALLETSDDLDREIDLTELHPLACGGEPSGGAGYYWFPGERPRLASNGKALVHGATTLYQCSRFGEVREGIHLVRYLDIGD